MERVDDNENERVMLLVLDNSLKQQLRLWFVKVHDVEDSKYEFDKAIARALQAQTIISSVWEQFLSAKSDVNKYFQRSPFNTKSFTTDLTIRFS